MRQNRQEYCDEINVKIVTSGPRRISLFLKWVLRFTPVSFIFSSVGRLLGSKIGLYIYEIILIKLDLTDLLTNCYEFEMLRRT